MIEFRIAMKTGEVFNFSTQDAGVGSFEEYYQKEFIDNDSSHLVFGNGFVDKDDISSLFCSGFATE